MKEIVLYDDVINTHVDDIKHIPLRLNLSIVGIYNKSINKS